MVLAIFVGLATAGSAPDYAQKNAWLSLPDRAVKDVDVFWVYPTVYNGKTVIAEIGDAQMRQAAEHTLHSQAAVFAQAANIYAPLYRQCNMKVLQLPPKEKDRLLSIGLKDVEAAFDYYLSNLNQGRPFILAGHSQGSNQLLELLKKRLAEPALRQRMVAAYVIGWSVTRDDLAAFPALKLCAKPESAGCVVTYNCVAKGYENKAPTITKGAVAINPLSWSAGTQLAPASDNLGAVFTPEKGEPKLVPHFTSAQVSGGALIVDPMDPGLLTELPFGPGVYHVYDYSLFFENLKKNAAQRIAAFKRASR